MVYKTESISERTIEVLESEKLNYTMYKQEKEQSRSSRQNKSMKTKFSMSLILFFIAHFSFAQMNDGTYNYENTKIKLTLILTDDGITIESATIHYSENNKVEKGTGLFRTANEMLWGEFQTETCNYETEFKENTLTLNLKSFECKNGIKPITYILKQKTT